MNQELKTCSKCGVTKLRYEDFHWRDKERGYVASKCKACAKLISAQDWANNTERVQKLRAASKARYDMIRNKLNELKDRPCADCSNRYPYFVMDFDHRDPSTKEFEIADKVKSYSPERILNEAAKCDVVCANCHRLRTFRHLS